MCACVCLLCKQTDGDGLRTHDDTKLRERERADQLIIGIRSIGITYLVCGPDDADHFKLLDLSNLAEH